MQKIAIAGVGLGALAVAVAGGYFYATNRAQSEIEATFAALRASGATAAHGPVSINLFSRRADITDIVIKPAGASGDVSIGRLVLDGIDIWATDFVAKRVELSNVVANNLGRATPDGRISVKMPSLTATSVRSARGASPAAAGATAAMDDLQRAMLAFSQVAAESITVPTLETSGPVRLPMSNSTPGSAVTLVPVNLVTKYASLRLDNVRDGRIGRIAFDKATIGSDKGAAFLNGSINGSAIADFDIMPLFGIGLANRTARDGFYLVYSKGTMGTYTVTTMDGAEFSMGGASTTGLEFNPAKFGYAQLRETMAALAAIPPEPTQAQLQSFMEALARVYKGMNFEASAISDLKVTGPKGAPQALVLTIGGMSMTRFIGGKLGEFRIDTVNGMAKSPSGATTPFKFGSFALQGFDIGKLMGKALELSAAGAGKQPSSPEKEFAMLSALEGIEVSDISMPDPRTGPPLGKTVQIDHLKASWGQFVNNLPSKIVLSFKGTTPLNPNDPSTAALRNLGFQSLSFSADTTTDWDAATRVGTGAFAVDALQLGALSANVKLGNIPRSAFSVRPGQLNAILPDLEIGALQLKLRDSGLVKIARGVLGGDAQSDPLAAIKQALVDPSKPGGTLSALLDGASAFLAKPGQTLNVSLKAKGRIPVSQFTTPGTFQAPDALVTMLDAFTAEVAVAP